MSIKGYKAFNKDMKCRGFQYEEGKTYEMEEAPDCCNNGFHFCENPLDTLNYYELTNSEFAEVEALGDIDRDSEDTKIATNKIKIGAKLGSKGFIQASIDFLWEKCKDKDNKEDEDVQASSGDNSQLASSGYNSKLASSGDYSQLASSGYRSNVSHEKGIKNIVCNVGVLGKAKGKKGDILVLAEYERLDLPEYETYVYKPICVKTHKVDGKTIKEDTFYILEDKKFKEVSEDY